MYLIIFVFLIRQEYNRILEVADNLRKYLEPDENEE